jgi:hypothetical protein
VAAISQALFCVAIAAIARIESNNTLYKNHTEESGDGSSRLFAKRP